VKEFIEFPGPAFLEVIIDTEAGVYPMVGPGQAYEEMITGDYIASRSPPPASEPGSSEMF
jgi:acetolactate synthase-1/2/3 large subunit